MKRIKILFTIDSLGGGGAERVLVQILHSLDKTCFEPILITCANVNSYKADFGNSVQVVSFDKKNRWEYPRLVRDFRLLVKEKRPDITIHFSMYSAGIALLAFVGQKRFFKTILAVRNNPSKVHSYIRFVYINNALNNLSYKNADLIVTNSLGSRDILTSQFSVPYSKLRTIYNPVNFDVIRGSSDVDVGHTFFDKKYKVILAVGRLTAQKRLDRLLRIFKCVYDTGSNYRLIILGQGELEDVLWKQVSDLGVKGVVDFPGFQINPYAWMSKASVVCLTSDYEGLPNVVLEAMACGKPIVSTDCPTGPNEIITNNENGVLVPLDDEQAFVRALLRVLNDRDFSLMLSAGAVKRAADFSKDIIISKYEALFRECVGCLSTS